MEIALDPRGFIVIGNYTAASTKDNDKPALEFLRQLSTYIMLSLSVFSCDISRSTAFCNFSFHKTSDFLFMKDLNHIIISNVQPSGNMRTLKNAKVYLYCTVVILCDCRDTATGAGLSGNLKKLR